MHTTGPWSADHLRIHKHGRFIANCDGLGDTTRQRESEANARLIAAAPDLLACLLDVLDSDGDLYSMDFDRYRAAIDKATREI